MVAAATAVRRLSAGLTLYQRQNSYHVTPLRFLRSNCPGAEGQCSAASSAAPSVPSSISISSSRSHPRNDLWRTSVRSRAQQPSAAFALRGRGRGRGHCPLRTSAVRRGVTFKNVYIQRIPCLLPLAAPARSGPLVLRRQACRTPFTFLRGVLSR